MHANHPLAALKLAALILGIALPATATAGDGHDHGDTAPAVTGTAQPRFAAVSESFELVGVLAGSQLTLYLDRFADNTPVRGAQIVLDMAGAKFSAQPQRDDTYGVTLPAAPPPGVLPITVTVTAGAEVDLLAGELDLHATAHDDDTAQGPTWRSSAGWAVAALAALAVVALTARRWRANRPLRTGGAA